MYLKKLIIFGFGQHEDRKFDLQSNMTVFLGENEAGKTTIQQFILSILFGFPLRNQGLQRYEPKTGGKHGGQVHLHHEKYGHVVIERVKGKSAGDVTVYLEDGTRGSDDLLRDVVYGYDRSSYEAIFSFSIHQLQQFEKMTEEEVSRTLLASGTTGVDQLAVLETKMGNELADLFKKAGKKPQMNVQLEKVRELETKIKEIREKTEHYEPSINRLNEITSSLERLRQEEHLITKDLSLLQKLKQAGPLFIEKEQLLEIQSENDQQQFPIDGVRRWESLRDKEKESDARITRLEEEIEELKNVLTNDVKEIDIASIDQFLTKEVEWHQTHAKLAEIQQKIVTLEDELEQEYQLVGIQTEEDKQRLLAQNVSLEKETAFLTALKHVEEVEKTLAQNKTNEAQVLDQRIIVREKLQQSEQPEDVEKIQAQVFEKEQQLAEAKLSNQSTSKSTTLHPLLLVGLSLGFSIIGSIVLSDYRVMILGIILAAILYMLAAKENTTSRETVSKETMEALEQELYDWKQRKEKAIVTKLQRDQLNEQLEEIERTIGRTQEALKLTQETYEEAKKSLTTFAEQEGLHQRTLNEGTFVKIRHLQRVEKQIDRLRQEYNSGTTQVNEWLAEGQSILQTPLTKESLFDKLREAKLAWSDQKRKQNDVETLLEQKEKEWKEKQQLKQAFVQEKENLLNEANVSEEKSFYLADQQHRTYVEATNRLKQIESQLTSIGIDDNDLNHLENTEQRVQELETRSRENTARRHELLEEQATLKQLTKSLMEDEAYGNLLQEFETEKAFLQELAKSWAVKKVVAETIRQTMSQLKEERLPGVMEEANRYFSELTGGKYHSLEWTEQEQVEAVTNDERRYLVGELSQATKEQAYVALRFALADSMLERAPLPLLLDDPFVHFDKHRMGHAIEAVMQLSTKHQVLYFTCHESIATSLPTATIVRLTKAEIERSVHS
ncbi:ATP-binding protein [Paenisporosarcina cavernae]|uniref:YhaN AAA domain-containing protein n=1 Tax=Paenisporosarcina cavernae TaxID=2320858 RepID=A0A385YU23_9BACL|nr:AAA family ATPase [Paenisporosarcina cavernae]AYC30176.1 hypothetical protein D3873_09955 [Paenisporosarcina cavernae]